MNSAVEITCIFFKVYKGLDIITNKVTTEEKQTIPHHLINIFDSAQEFTVIDFKKPSLNTIAELTKRNKIPIIVGGTNYFIEAILWDFLIEGGISFFFLFSLGL